MGEPHVPQAKPFTVEEGHRRIRSFVLRQGRFTDAQQRAFDELWPRYGLDYTGMPRDLDAAFAVAERNVGGEREAELLRVERDPLVLVGHGNHHPADRRDVRHVVSSVGLVESDDGEAAERSAHLAALSSGAGSCARRLLSTACRCPAARTRTGLAPRDRRDGTRLAFRRRDTTHRDATAGA